MTQSTRWTSSRARMRKRRGRRHVGFLYQRSRPRRRSSGITLLMCHMLPGAVHEAQGAEARADSESWPYIQVVDSKYGRGMAVKCVTKGSQDECAVKALENFCRRLGVEKFFLHSDPEHSIQDVVGKVCAKIPGGMARTTRKQSKQSLGLAERFHGTVESDCRVLLLSVLNSYKIEFLPPMHPIFDWLVRHAAWVHERFRRSRHHGRSAFTFSERIPARSYLSARQ